MANIIIEGEGSSGSGGVHGVRACSVTDEQLYESANVHLPLIGPLPLPKYTKYLQKDDLIKNFGFKTAPKRIKATPDGNFLIASGGTPSQVKVFDLNERSFKFERHFDTEITNFQILSDDYSRLAFLCTDGSLNSSINLHGKHVQHYNIQIPRTGRDIEYDSSSDDLLCAASSPDLYRINLEQGRFLSSHKTQSPTLNVVARSKFHGLVACGGGDGAVECFDKRLPYSVGRMRVYIRPGAKEITALEFDGGGYLLGVGCSEGKAMVYDLRYMGANNRIKKHMYSNPVLGMKWHHCPQSEKSKLITIHRQVVKIWDPDTLEGLINIEPPTADINDFVVFKDSGLITLALESSGPIPSFFVPALGPAPGWCSYLQTVEDGMEEGASSTIYDQFKFLTEEDVKKVNMTHLMGTNLLPECAHGYFSDERQYDRAKRTENLFQFYHGLRGRSEQTAVYGYEKNRNTILTRLIKDLVRGVLDGDNTLKRLYPGWPEKKLAHTHTQENEKKDIDGDTIGMDNEGCCFPRLHEVKEDLSLKRRRGGRRHKIQGKPRSLHPLGTFKFWKWASSNHQKVFRRPVSRQVLLRTIKRKRAC